MEGKFNQPITPEEQTAQSLDLLKRATDREVKPQQVMLSMLFADGTMEHSFVGYPANQALMLANQDVIMKERLRREMRL